MKTTPKKRVKKSQLKGLYLNLFSIATAKKVELGNFTSDDVFIIRP